MPHAMIVFLLHSQHESNIQKKLRVDHQQKKMTQLASPTNAFLASEFSGGKYGGNSPNSDCLAPSCRVAQVSSPSSTFLLNPSTGGSHCVLLPLLGNLAQCHSASAWLPLLRQHPLMSVWRRSAQPVMSTASRSCPAQPLALWPCTPTRKPQPRGHAPSITGARPHIHHACNDTSRPVLGHNRKVPVPSSTGTVKDS